MPCDRRASSLDFCVYRRDSGIAVRRTTYRGLRNDAVRTASRIRHTPWSSFSFFLRSYKKQAVVEVLVLVLALVAVQAVGVGHVVGDLLRLVDGYGEQVGRIARAERVDGLVADFVDHL